MSKINKNTVSVYISYLIWKLHIVIPCLSDVINQIACMSLHNTVICCVKLSQFSIQCFTVQKIKLSRKRGYFQICVSPSIFLLNVIQCLVKDIEN